MPPDLQARLCSWSFLNLSVSSFLIIWNFLFSPLKQWFLFCFVETRSHVVQAGSKFIVFVSFHLLWNTLTTSNLGEEKKMYFSLQFQVWFVISGKLREQQLEAAAHMVTSHPQRRAMNECMLGIQCTSPLSKQSRPQLKLWPCPQCAGPSQFNRPLRKSSLTRMSTGQPNPGNSSLRHSPMVLGPSCLS